MGTVIDIFFKLSLEIESERNYFCIAVEGRKFFLGNIQFLVAVPQVPTMGQKKKIARLPVQSSFENTSVLLTHGPAPRGMETSQLPCFSTRLAGPGVINEKLGLGSPWDPSRALTPPTKIHNYINKRKRWPPSDYLFACLHSQSGVSLGNFSQLD